MRRIALVGDIGSGKTFFSKVVLNGVLMLDLTNRITEFTPTYNNEIKNKEIDRLANEYYKLIHP